MPYAKSDSWHLIPNVEVLILMDKQAKKRQMFDFVK